MGRINQKILPHLWYDKEATEAAQFYASVLPDSRVTNVTTRHDTPSGDCDVVSFELWRHKFMAISAGPLFKFNPSVSFMVNFDPLFFDPSPSREKDAREKIDEVWEKLSDGGTVLMPIGQYPFSERYGWVQDKYGLSWQLILTNPAGDPRPSIVPFMSLSAKTAARRKQQLSSICPYSGSPSKES
jgi:predicted 3-demethylubiquinone-9 3-methyltransferase (glyoxalase superfamily)